MNKKKLPKAIRPTARKPATEAARPSRAATPDAGKVSPSRSKAGATAAVDSDRRLRATKVVDRFSFWSGVAGLLPIPFVDLAAVAALQIQMLRLISRIYDVPFSENRGKALVAGIFGTVIPVSTGVGMASVVKSIPIAGTAVGALATPALAVAATYAIGRVFIQHFASGGTLLDFEPPNYREFISREMQSHLGRSSKTTSARSEPT
ncbi:MAG TPA: YcjF family protein [Pseudolabrys sp.]|nr:YcjF family protein [Pseudolabrys sp.]